MLKSICHAVACKRTTSSSSYYNRKRNSTYGAIWLALTTWASHAAAGGCSQCVIWCRWLPAALIPAQRRCLFQTPRFVLPSTADLLMDFQDHEHSCGCWKSFGTNVEFLRTPDSGKVALISPADERQHTFSVPGRRQWYQEPRNRCVSGSWPETRAFPLHQLLSAGEMEKARC